jgi:hypothetical protein
MRNIMVVLSLFLCSCSCPPGSVVQVGVVDEGFMVEGTKNLRPGALPFSITTDWTVHDSSLLSDIVERWQGWLGTEQGVVVADDMAQVVLSIGYVPTASEDETILGISRVRFAEDGTILGGEIVLSSDYDYSTGRETLVQAGCHEVGHAVFALADDPGPPTTVDLRSIMSDPLDPLGRLTAADLARLEPYLP